MAPWVRKVFVDVLPKYLFIRRPDRDDDDEEDLMMMYDDGNGSSNNHNNLKKMSKHSVSSSSNEIGEDFDDYGGFGRNGGKENSNMMAFAENDGGFGYTLSPIRATLGPGHQLNMISERSLPRYCKIG